MRLRRFSPARTYRNMPFHAMNTESANSPDADVIIIGAGVVGLATALALTESGRKVRVLDAGRVGGGSSHGNCGTLTPSHAAPLAAPGAVAKGLRWMLTPDAPFYLRPRLDPVLWAWLWRFAARCNRNDWLQGMADKGRILVASREGFPEWIARYGLQCEFSEEGYACVFRDAAEFDDYCRKLPYLADIGILSETVDGNVFEREEPALKPGLTGAVRFRGDARLRPDRYVAELARALRERGGEINEHCTVDAATETGTGVEVIAAGRRYRAGQLVVAAGAWSATLGSSLGLAWLRGVIQPGKGYSITYSRPELVPRQPITLHERSICVTVWDSGFRLGSTMEISGYDTSLNRRRLDALERGAAEYLHVPTGPAKQEEWYGWRPLSFDDLPLIGLAPGRERTWLATGHGMMGVSMSVATARLIDELMTGKQPHLDPAPYAPGRFV